ncbi:ankyrin unc44 [Colletotrichum scovillei]|uniref:Ankyrin unc44 n=1 Tax=Colletotrichum scovillei TaxID=1209932 RepID=A0A9P7U6Q5_9PEZI|nr:ankyrin unc44 [Colletotrichum scovillei]KAG7041710.1 ankyrin unc44 [Colletotrichum scovillei]KAG7061738.1 ankyrin unc44 [Colletotrichum scovillei]
MVGLRYNCLRKILETRKPMEKAEPQNRGFQFIDGLPYEILNEIGLQLLAKDALSLIRCSRRCAAIVGWSLYHLDSLNGHQALFWGAETGQLSAVKMAIAHGASPSSPVIDPDYDFGATLNRETALSVAIGNNEIDVVRYLLRACPSIGNFWAEKSYLLHSVKCPKLMEVLLAGGFSNGVNTLGRIDAWENDDVTPLVAAIERNHPDSTIRTLLKFGARLNSQNVSSMRPHLSAFHIGLWSDRTSVIRMLMEHNADVNEAEGPEPWSNTPLVVPTTPTHIEKTPKDEVQRSYDSALLVFGGVTTAEDPKTHPGWRIPDQMKFSPFTSFPNATKSASIGTTTRL